MPSSSTTPWTEHGSIQFVPIEAIGVDSTLNPRRRLVDIEDLAASIREHGLLQPLVVRPDPDDGERYLLVAGHRRMAAMRLLAERTEPATTARIPVLVRNEHADQAYVLALVENLQREDLSPREEAEALGRLVRERRWTTRQVAAAVYRSQAYVSRRLRVYEDKALRALVLADELSVSVAEELLAADQEKRASLAKRAVREQWDQKRARAESRGHTGAFHPQLRAHVHEIRDLVAHTSLSTGERQLLRQLAEFLLSHVSNQTSPESSPRL
jgi:ParB family chromosome partitioning protein